MRSLLPDTQIVGSPGAIPVRMNVPLGAKRLSLLVWTRFGEEVGYILDEIRPTAGSRVFQWEGIDSHGAPIAPGDYVIRIIVDDLTASSLLTVSEPSPRGLRVAEVTGVARRAVSSLARESRFKSLGELVAAPTHDISWLHDALQTAVQLELSTLPPYLIARWSIRSPGDPVAQTIKQIAREEMLHMGLACNMLTAIGGSPDRRSGRRAEISRPFAVGYTPGPGGHAPASLTKLRPRSSWRSNIRNMVQSRSPAGRR